MQAAAVSDKVASQSHSPVVMEIRGAHHPHAQGLPHSVAGRGQGSSGGKIGAKHLWVKLWLLQTPAP